MRTEGDFSLHLSHVERVGRFAERLRIPREALSDGVPAVSGDLEYDYSVAHVGGTQFYLDGVLRGRSSAACDRCLEPVVRPLEIRAASLLIPAPQEGSEPTEEDDQAAHYAANKDFPVLPFLEAEIFLQLPMRRLCREDCRGLCPRCGENRNAAACGCVVEAAAVDPRLAPLLAMKTRLGKARS